MKCIDVDFRGSRIKALRHLGTVRQLVGRDGVPCRDFNRYLIQNCIVWSTRTTQTYAGHLARLGTWLEAAQILPSDMIVDHVARYAHALARERRMKPGSAIAAIAAAGRYLKWRDRRNQNDVCNEVQPAQIYKSALTRLGILEKPVTSPIRFARLDDAETHHQTVGSAELFGRHAKRNELMSRLMSESGLRVSEVVSLPVASLPAAHLGAGNTLMPVVGKGRKLRFVTVASRLLNELLTYVEIERDAIVGKLPVRRRPKEVFVGRTGRCMSTGYVQEIFRIASRRTQMRISPHTLRHTFGTYDYLLNRDLTRTQKLMGHSSPDTTQMYVGTAVLTDHSDKYEAFLNRIREVRK